MRSYKPEELFDKDGRLIPELKALAPKGHRRMSANPIANGGLVTQATRHAGFPQLPALKSRNPARPWPVASPLSASFSGK